jgi:hypothetical protein
MSYHATEPEAPIMEPRHGEPTVTTPVDRDPIQQADNTLLEPGIHDPQESEREKIIATARMARPEQILNIGLANRKRLSQTGTLPMRA